jgi:hypothetical protein
MRGCWNNDQGRDFRPVPFSHPHPQPSLPSRGFHRDCGKRPADSKLTRRREPVSPSPVVILRLNLKSYRRLILRGAEKIFQMAQKILLTEKCIYVYYTTITRKPLHPRGPFLGNLEVPIAHALKALAVVLTVRSQAMLTSTFCPPLPVRLCKTHSVLPRFCVI